MSPQRSVRRPEGAPDGGFAHWRTVSAGSDSSRVAFGRLGESARPTTCDTAQNRPGSSAPCGARFRRSPTFGLVSEVAIREAKPLRRSASLIRTLGPVTVHRAAIRQVRDPT